MKINQPNQFVRAAIQRYTHFHGFPTVVEGHAVSVDKECAKQIASAYDLLEEKSEAGIVRISYAFLGAEILDQWSWAEEEMGMIFEPWKSEGQPYANSSEMCEDVREYRHMFFFTGGEVHPYLGIVGPDGLSLNDKFRAVHDLFGHSAEGYQFGQQGEENAWVHHSMMFSDLAQRALTTETRMQNSWVNSGPYSHLPVTQRPYAVQKADLGPAWVWDWRAVLFA